MVRAIIERGGRRELPLEKEAKSRGKLRDERNNEETEWLAGFEFDSRRLTTG